MKSLFVALAILAGAIPAFAGEVVVDTGNKAGTFYLKVVVAADGSATISPLKVVRLGEPTNPTDPTDPDPTDPTAFSKAIQAQTQAALDSGGTKTTGARISAVYSLVATSVADDSIPVSKALDAIKLGTDMALQGQADSAKWVKWRTSTGDALAVLQQDGSLATKAQYAQAFREIAAGMNAATGFEGNVVALQNIDPKNAGILDGIDLAKIIDLIKMLLELFKLFKP